MAYGVQVNIETQKITDTKDYIEFTMETRVGNSLERRRMGQKPELKLAVVQYEEKRVFRIYRTFKELDNKDMPMNKTDFNKKRDAVCFDYQFKSFNSRYWRKLNSVFFGYNPLLVVHRRFPVIAKVSCHVPDKVFRVNYELLMDEALGYLLNTNARIDGEIFKDAVTERGHKEVFTKYNGMIIDSSKAVGLKVKIVIQKLNSDFEILIIDDEQRVLVRQVHRYE